MTPSELSKVAAKLPVSDAVRRLNFGTGVGDEAEAPQAPAVAPHARPSTLRFTVHYQPMGAPRMTRRDKWAKRPVVQRYHELCDAIRAVVGEQPVPDQVHCRFWIEMPESWSEKKKRDMSNLPHQQVPDVDNLQKAVLDALWENDGAIWKCSQEKYWTRSEPRIEITMIWT